MGLLATRGLAVAGGVNEVVGLSHTGSPSAGTSPGPAFSHVD